MPPPSFGALSPLHHALPVNATATSLHSSKGLYPVAPVATVWTRTNVQIVVIRPLTEAQISGAFGSRGLGLMVGDAVHSEVFTIIHAAVCACPKSIRAAALRLWIILSLTHITGERGGDLVAFFIGLDTLAAVATLRI